MSAVQITADHARRFLVVRHLLAPARALPARSASVLDVVDRLGLLQFDPLEVPGARNHDLVLHARIANYEREWADEWLYGSDRRLIELYNKSLNIVPMAELPHYRIAWKRSGGIGFSSKSRSARTFTSAGSLAACINISLSLSSTGFGIFAGPSRPQ